MIIGDLEHYNSELSLNWQSVRTFHEAAHRRLPTTALDDCALFSDRMRFVPYPMLT